MGVVWRVGWGDETRVEVFLPPVGVGGWGSRRSRNYIGDLQAYMVCA